VSGLEINRHACLPSIAKLNMSSSLNPIPPFNIDVVSMFQENQIQIITVQRTTPSVFPNGGHQDLANFLRQFKTTDVVISGNRMNNSFLEKHNSRKSSLTSLDLTSNTFRNMIKGSTFNSTNFKTQVAITESFHLKSQHFALHSAELGPGY
jgi:hypothetical protein